jgi:hypothetical protein
MDNIYEVYLFDFWDYANARTSSLLELEAIRLQFVRRISSLLSQNPVIDNPRATGIRELEGLALPYWMKHLLKMWKTRDDEIELSSLRDSPRDYSRGGGFYVLPDSPSQKRETQDYYEEDVLKPRRQREQEQRERFEEEARRKVDEERQREANQRRLRPARQSPAAAGGGGGGGQPLVMEGGMFAAKAFQMDHWENDENLKKNLKAQPEERLAWLKQQSPVFAKVLSEMKI